MAPRNMPLADAVVALMDDAKNPNHSKAREARSRRAIASLLIEQEKKDFLLRYLGYSEIPD